MLPHGLGQKVSLKKILDLARKLNMCYQKKNFIKSVQYRSINKTSKNELLKNRDMIGFVELLGQFLFIC